VFKNRNDNRFVDIKKAWQSVLESAEIENFRFHDLRHHFASRLVMLGVPLNTIRELLGHSDLATTLRYAHLDQGHKADAVALLEN
jgi:integrase